MVITDGQPIMEWALNRGRDFYATFKLITHFKLINYLIEKVIIVDVAIRPRFGSFDM